MSKWEVIVLRSPKRYLKKLPPIQRERFLDAFDILKTGDFDSLDIKALKNRSGYRLRVGDYRALFEKDTENKVLVVTTIAPRGDVYKK